MHKDTARTTRRAGFSLLETIVTATLLASVLMATFAVMHAGSSTMASGEARASALEDGRVMLDRVCRPLSEARVTTIGTAGDSLTYLAPVYTGEQGIDFDMDYDITWGSESEPVGGTTTVSFETISTLDENAEKIDYNRDGDTADLFDRGRLVRVDDTTGQIVALGGESLILPFGDHAGDLNNDGLGDPLFTMVEGTLGSRYDIFVSLWTVRTDRNRNPYLVRLKKKVTLRNAQN